MPPERYAALPEDGVGLDDYVRARLAERTDDLDAVEALSRMVELHPDDELGDCRGCHQPVPCPTKRWIAWSMRYHVDYEDWWRP